MLALSAVAGLGWLASQNGGADSAASKSNGAADAKSLPGASGGRSDGRTPPPDPERALACDRLVVEGTVARVEPQKAPGFRIVLTVMRHYEPDHGPDRVTFLLDDGAEPQPRRGQHVLVAVERGTDDVSLWAVGDDRVAANRAWITEALPRALRAPCPSGGPS